MKAKYDLFESKTKAKMMELIYLAATITEKTDVGCNVTLWSHYGCLNISVIHDRHNHLYDFELNFDKHPNYPAGHDEIEKSKIKICEKILRMILNEKKVSVKVKKAIKKLIEGATQ